MVERPGMEAASTGVRREFEKAAIGQIVKNFGEPVAREGWKGLPEVVGKYLEREKIHPRFIQEHSDTFKVMRESLRTEAGLFVANHPAGYIDVPITLSMVTREDVLIYTQARVKEGLVRALEHHFGPELAASVGSHLLTNAKKDAIGNFRQALSHVENGGLLVLYPTAGKEQKASAQVTFEPGLRAFLNKLAPETMLYAVNYEIEGSPAAKNSKQFAKRAASLEFPALDRSGITNPISVAVDERFTRVEDWKGVTKSDEAITGKYWELFSVEGKGINADG